MNLSPVTFLPAANKNILRGDVIISKSFFDTKKAARSEISNRLVIVGTIKVQTSQIPTPIFRFFHKIIMNYAMLPWIRIVFFKLHGRIPD